MARYCLNSADLAPLRSLPRPTWGSLRVGRAMCGEALTARCQRRLSSPLTSCRCSYPHLGQDCPHLGGLHAIPYPYHAPACGKEGANSGSVADGVAKLGGTVTSDVQEEVPHIETPALPTKASLER